MSWEMVAALIATTSALVAIPGPNVAFIAANTLSHGARYGAVTVLGTTFGVAIQLAIVVFGFSVILSWFASGFILLKWLGVLYLCYLGIQSWRASESHEFTVRVSTSSAATLFWRGLFLAIINPKTLVFSAAFLPQFVGDPSSSFALLQPALLYLAVIFVGDLGWVALSHCVAPALRAIGQLRHKLTGGLFLVSGFGLAFAKNNP